MTAMTLVAAFASFIFMPLAQALIDELGWRDALLVLALILAATTVPLHAWGLRGAAHAPSPQVVSAPAGDVLRSRSFWELSAAYFLASLAAIAAIVLAIPFLLERGYDATFAAFAVGLIGVSQIPGRVLFAPLAARASEAVTTATVFALIGVGIAVLVGVDGEAAVIAGMVLLGIGNGMATLARATTIADRYGQAAYGTIGAVAASVTTFARAIGPVAAAGYAVAVGYTGLLWTLVALASAATLLALHPGTGTLRSAMHGACPRS
jgi:cyanate permease